MIKNNVSIQHQISALLVIVSLSMCASAPTPSPTPAPSAPLDWRATALHAPKNVPHYYYQLLNDGGEPAVENEITNRFAAAGAGAPPGADIAVIRSTVIDELYNNRLTSINNPPAPTPEEGNLIIEELNNARDILGVNATAQLYKYLGHDAYIFIRSRHAPFLGTLAGIPDGILIKLRTAAQFLLSLSKQDTPDPAAAAAEAMAADRASDASSLDADDDIIAAALGKELYSTIKAQDKQQLKDWVTNNAPADPTHRTFLYSVLKEYMRILLCKIAESGCPTAPSPTVSGDGSKTGDTKRSGDSGSGAGNGSTPTVPGTSPATGGNKKMLEDLGKANDNLQGALHYLKQAKGYLGKVKTAERKYIKGRITQILNDHKPVKQLAEKLQKNSVQGAEAFIQTVADIYKEASGF